MPAPRTLREVSAVSVGVALLLTGLSQLSRRQPGGGIDGLPANLNDQKISLALETAAAKGPLAMLTVLQSLPGQTASVDLSRALLAVQRLANQQKPADTLLAAVPPASVDPALSKPGPLTVQRRETQIPVSYRSEPLKLVVISPIQGANGRLVLISHGLWDSPASFEGWGRHLVITDSTTNTRLSLYDWQNNSNKIESFQLTDGTFSFQQLQQKVTSVGASVVDSSLASWDTTQGASQLTNLGLGTSASLDSLISSYKTVDLAGAIACSGVLIRCF